MKSVGVLYILVVALSLSLHAAIPETSLFKQLKKYEKNVSNLKKEISLLEKQLGDTNKRYITVLERRKVIDRMIEKQRKELVVNLANIETNSTYVKKLFQSLVAHSMGSGNKSWSEVLSKDLIEKSLRGRLERLRQSKHKNEELTGKMEELHQKYREYVDIEEGILNLIRDWEYYKKEKTQNYASQFKKLKSIKSKYKPRSLKRPLGKLFNNPVERYIDIKHGKKGVTYYTRGHQKIRNVRTGKVVYSNKLSTFGNVLMVDHGGNIRSIFLGQFVPKLKKGARVKTGDILGYTNGVKNRQIKVYFEIRKKNKAQNTIRFINQESLAKAKVKSIKQRS